MSGLHAAREWVARGEIQRETMSRARSIRSALLAVEHRRPTSWVPATSWVPGRNRGTWRGPLPHVAGTLLVGILALPGCGGGGGSGPGTPPPPPPPAVEDRIAFVSSRDRTGSGGLNKEIYTMGPDGSGPARLTVSDAIDISPCWAPDRRTLFFASDRSGSYAIYRANVDGTGLLNLTPGTVPSGAPACSPDGTRLAYVCWTPRGSEICVMNVDGTGNRFLTENDVLDGGPAWSPDGTQIYFSSMRDVTGQRSFLYRMKADGTDQRPVGSEIEILGRPAVSPDGKRILFAGPSPEGTRLFIVDASGGTPVPIGEPQSGEPAWSPDGRQILFTSWRDGNAELYRMNADGTGTLRLTNNLDDDGGAAWR